MNKQPRSSRVSTKSRKTPDAKGAARSQTKKGGARPASTEKTRQRPSADHRRGRTGEKILSARGADRHVLYEKSVQDPEFEVKLLEKLARRYRTQVRALREDFCGTALLCAHWVRSGKERTATGIDLDPEVLSWGRTHNLEPLGSAQSRVTLLEQDVTAPVKKRHDAVVALNFSYWIFKTRAELRAYFARVRKGLDSQGFFLLDAYGGWESQEPMFEPRKIREGFTYVWDQDAFDPITNEMLTHIHFEFRDGTKLNRAFSYDWRFWSLPELRELLLEAGFAHVDVLWDDTDDDEDPDYRPRRHATNQPGWIAYLIALPTLPKSGEHAARVLAKARSGKR